MRWIRYAAVLSLLVLVAGCGESKDRAAEAEKIKQDLTAGFDVMFGKDKLKFVGYDKLDVVPDGDSYKATLSGIKIMPNEPDAPKLGDVTFNVDAEGRGQVSDQQSDAAQRRRHHSGRRPGQGAVGDRFPAVQRRVVEDLGRLPGFGRGLQERDT